MSTSPREREISLLRSQAAPVFRRKAFRHAVWVGICYDSLFGPRATLPKLSPVEIVIFYDPKYSEDQIWDSYSCEPEEDGFHEDPDKPKLKRAWGRKVKIWRVFEGALRSYKDFERVFQAGAQTLHGNFNNSSLQKFRSTYYQKAEEYCKKLKESVDRLSIAEESIKSGSEASQHAHQIAEILKFDIKDPLRYLVKTSHGFAKALAEKGSHDASWPKLLNGLLMGDQIVADSLIAVKGCGTRRVVK